MKRILLVFSLVYCLYGDNKIPFKDANFGFLSDDIILQNFNEARVALSFWLSNVGKQYDINIDAKYYKSLDDIYKGYFNKKEIDCIIIPFSDYFKDRKKIEKFSDNFWSLKIKGNVFQQYYLISQKNKTNSLKNIKNKTLALKGHNLQGSIWLDKRSLEINKKGYKALVSNVIKEEKESSLVLKVFFNKVDYAVITKDTWDTMLELNPAISKTLKIVDKSKRVHLQFVGFFNKDFDKESKKTFFEASKNLKKLPQGEQLMTMLKFDSTYKLKKDMLKDLEKFYLEYYNLKKRYSK